MKADTWLVVGCSLVLAVSSVGFGAEYVLVPTGASGDYSFDGDEIILEGGGQRVSIDLYMSGWNPANLKAWQATLDSISYSSGLHGTLSPAYVACTAPDNTPCETALGVGSLCDVPPGSGVACTAGYIDSTRGDYVFFGLSELTGIDLSTLDYRYASTLLFGSVSDPGTARYAGTLVLDVPVGALGTFTITLKQALMQDDLGGLITPLTLTPAVVTVLCVTDGDCDDGNACTNDDCRQTGPQAGTCAYTDNYNPQDECCDPSDGSVVPIDDGEECTTDECDPETGIVTHEPVLDGTPCDDELYCNIDETCLGGVCQGGTPRDCSHLDGQCTLGVCNEGQDMCVADPINENQPCDDLLFCTDDDVCVNGECTGSAHDCSYLDDQCNVGVCNEEIDDCEPEPANENDPCDDSDRCNVGETCQSGECTGGNPQDCSTAGDQCNAASCDPGGTEGNCDIITPVLDGTPCNDGLYCNVDEACWTGVCSGGVDRDCADTVGCTEDTCNETSDRCVHTPIDAYCPDDGLFCNGDEYCDVDTDCDHTGSPCAGPCDEEEDRCLCETPLIGEYTTVGLNQVLITMERYLKILPQPFESGPQAIVITPDCPDSTPWYVGPPVATMIDGELVNLAELVPYGGEAWHTPAEWGELYVFGEMITPGTTYNIQGDCGSPGSPGLSGTAVATTARWGDTAGPWEWDPEEGGRWTPADGLAQIIDVLVVIEKFKAMDDAVPLLWADLVGIGQTGVACTPDQSVDIIDAVAALDGFKNLPYPMTTGCPVPCP
jgi:hypothetical protein